MSFALFRRLAPSQAPPQKGLHRRLAPSQAPLKSGLRRRLAPSHPPPQKGLHRRLAPALAPSLASFQALCLCASLTACGGPQAVIRRADELPAPPASRGFLKLTTCEPQVKVYVDGRFKGHVGDYPFKALLLPRGEHRLELRRAGHMSLYLLIEVSPERPVEVSEQPTPLPPSPPQPSL